MTFTFDPARSPRIVQALNDWRLYIDGLPAGDEQEKEELVWSIWHSWVDDIAENGWDEVLYKRDATSWLYGIGKGGRYLGGGYQELRSRNDALDIAHRMRACGYPRCGEAADFLLECYRTGRFWGKNTDNSIFSRNHDDLASAANDMMTAVATFDLAAETISWELDHELWGLVHVQAALCVVRDLTTEPYYRGIEVKWHDLKDRLTGTMTFAEAGLKPERGWSVKLQMGSAGGAVSMGRGYGLHDAPWGVHHRVGNTPIDDSKTTIPTFTLRGQPFDPVGPKPGYRWDLYHFIRDQSPAYINALFIDRNYAARFDVLNEASDLEWAEWMRNDAALESWLDPEATVDLDELRDTYTIVPMPDLVLRGKPLPMELRIRLEDVPFAMRGRAVTDNILPRLERINALSDEDFGNYQQS